MILLHRRLFAPYGERDIKLTEYRGSYDVPRHKSLYIGLFSNIIAGILLALLSWGVTVVPTSYLISRQFVTEDRRQIRREEYLADLQTYVIEEHITLETSNEISDWVRSNPYVYLMIYQREGDQTPLPSTGAVAPSAKDRLTELSGARIEKSMSRDELVRDARSYGYVRINLIDGSIIVAMAEYTENLYYTVVNAIGIILAAITFVLILVRYIRVIIERIKRFESDITIVSEIDMNYEIISEGADEIANLSAGVETMRRTMLSHIQSEHEAREANTELITAISHDIRTPLTVLMGYIEMMKEHGDHDEVMQGYISATESTAMRLKQLSDDMFKYSLAFGDTEKSIKLEEYDALTLLDQLLAEHILLMREKGYEMNFEGADAEIMLGARVLTDPTNLMRIVDNVFSNITKYADPEHPITMTLNASRSFVVIECKNKIRRNTDGAESNGIGLKTCVRLGSLVAKKFEYEKTDDFFTCRLVFALKRSDEDENRQAN